MHTWIKNTFTLDTLDAQVFTGYWTGDVWNGWACPYFERDEAENVLHASEANDYRWHYDAEADAFIVRSDADSDDYEAEIFEGVNAQVDGSEVRLYGIGANAWAWQASSTIG